MSPNRIAVYLTAGAGLATAVAPVVANMDINSTIGLAVGFLGIATVVRKWLEGWQLYEERTAMGREGVVDETEGETPVVPPGLSG